MNFMKSQKFIIFLSIIIILLYLSQYIIPDPKVEEVAPDPAEVQTEAPQEP